MTDFLKPPERLAAAVRMTEQEFSCYVRGSPELWGYGTKNGEHYWLHQGHWIKVEVVAA